MSMYFAYRSMPYHKAFVNMDGDKNKRITIFYALTQMTKYVS